jgi:O-antigen ligase
MSAGHIGKMSVRSSRYILHLPGLLRAHEDRIAFLVGLLDASGYLLYLTGVDETLWHSATLAIKSAMLVLTAKYLNGPGKEFKLLFTLLSISIVVSSIVNIGNIGVDTLFKYFAVIVSMYTTMCLIRKHFRAYSLAYVIHGLICVLLYVIMVFRGGIDDYFGRYLFFNGTHFNLGCEIMVAFAVATAQTTRKIVALPLCVAYLYATSLMQGRSAMLAICIVIALMLYSIIIYDRGIGRLCAIAGLLISVSAALLQSSVREKISDAFLVTDQYRGMDSGFSGRDDYWGAALDTFVSSPWFGAGIGSENESGLQAHNFFLYGISQFGLSVLPFFLALIVLLATAVLNSNRNGWYIAAFAALLVFNDRFINMNIYPFFFYVSVLTYAAERTQLAATLPFRTIFLQRSKSRPNDGLFSN